VPAKRTLVLVIVLLAIFLLNPLLNLPAFSQQAPGPASAQPQVKVNVLNVCAPSTEEQQEIATALSHIPKRPLFSPDFEVSHGRSTLTDTANFLQPGQNVQMSGGPSVARYVRIRHEFSVQAPFSSVQYSFSDDGQNMVETLVLHMRDPKELVQVSIEDSASSISSVGTMLAANTPASRIRLERFGKSSVALVRCAASENGPAPDQSAYEPLFHTASEVMANYRGLLAVRRTVPAELAQIPGASTKASKSAGDKK